MSKRPHSQTGSDQDLKQGQGQSSDKKPRPNSSKQDMNRSPTVQELTDFCDYYELVSICKKMKIRKLGKPKTKMTMAERIVASGFKYSQLLEIQKERQMREQKMEQEEAVRNTKMAMQRMAFFENPSQDYEMFQPRAIYNQILHFGGLCLETYTTLTSVSIIHPSDFGKTAKDIHGDFPLKWANTKSIQGVPFQKNGETPWEICYASQPVGFNSNQPLIQTAEDVIRRVIENPQIQDHIRTWFEMFFKPEGIEHFKNHVKAQRQALDAEYNKQQVHRPFEPLGSSIFESEETSLSYRSSPFWDLRISVPPHVISHLSALTYYYFAKYNTERVGCYFQPEKQLHLVRTFHQPIRDWLVTHFNLPKQHYHSFLTMEFIVPGEALLLLQGWYQGKRNDSIYRFPGPLAVLIWSYLIHETCWINA